MTELELPLIQAGACGCGHDHAGHDHSHAAHDEHADPALAEFERNFTEIAHLMQERFGGVDPTEEEEKDFMREWLMGKGRSAEEAEAILNTPLDA